ncbi:DNA-directed RNA polymerase, subunit E'' [Candidatus Micrarchaeota archaeon]|nr:DNA-directed RNA polymerase, subunit E'' [Candidatus Micrarchaeota archaeon]
MAVEKACTQCKRILSSDECPVCKTSALTKSWEGSIIVIDPNNSEIAKKIGATTPGRYALKVK